MLCDQSKKFERLYTKSLKKALDLPLHLPNDILLKVSGVPSLIQIAGHHVRSITTTIQNRFGCSPSSLKDLVAVLSQAGEEYQTLNTLEPIRLISCTSFILDLLGEGRGFERDVLGLATGLFLTLRCTKDSEGTKGHLRKCQKCGASASHEHFLNECLINYETRKLLLRPYSI